MSAPHLRDIMPRHVALAAWERQRNKKEVHWIMECFAEMVRTELVAIVRRLTIFNPKLGVFLYCYFGEQISFTSMLEFKCLRYLLDRNRIYSRICRRKHTQADWALQYVSK